jgi:hypothetical protein
MNNPQSLWKLVSILLALAAGGCGTAVIGGIVEEDAGASSSTTTTSTTTGGSGSSGVDCYTCACTNLSTDPVPGCADVCDGMLVNGQPFDYCNGSQVTAACAVCMASRCGVSNPAQCERKRTCRQCACSYTSGSTPMGCADTCDADLGSQPMPNFCNGGPPHSQCDLCIADRCGETDLSQCD